MAENRSYPVCHSEQRLQVLFCFVFIYRVSLCSLGWLGTTWNQGLVYIHLTSQRSPCLCHLSDNPNTLMWDVYGQLILFHTKKLKEPRKGHLPWLVFYLGLGQIPTFFESHPGVK